MAEQRCFQNGTLQLLHKLADAVLLILIAIVAWWASNIDRRVADVAQEQARRTSRIEEIVGLRADVIALRVQHGNLEAIYVTLKRHEEMLRRIEDRLNSLSLRLRTKDGEVLP